MSTRWLVLSPDEPGGAVHVVPEGEAHEVDGDACPCLPRETDDDVFTHNAFDKREVGEVLRALLDLLAITSADPERTWEDEDRDTVAHAERLLLLHWPGVG